MRRALSLLLVALAGMTVLAHGVELHAHPSGEAIVVELRYAGGGPIAGAHMTVYEPGGVVQVHQEGRSDREGRFAFVPTRAGRWSVVADDGMGHRAQLDVPYDAERREGAPAARPAAPNVLARWLVGLGVLGVLFATLFVWRSRRDAASLS